MTTGEWSCLISFAWDPLSGSEQAGLEKFKMKIHVCVSSVIRTHVTLRHATPRLVKQRFRPLGNDSLMKTCGLMSYRIVG